MLRAPQRSDVVAMLAPYGDRRPDDVSETIDSIELAWLMHQIEQRYGDVDIDDETLLRMTTVTGVVEALQELLVRSGDD
jgi:hypothetical protein